ncbi:hypothetical protein [Natronorubrum sp. FCH18a]|uniref:hypothetical protein n=1 Tax=Natronorubrum sp. FCH18a TaxID=3447018 RepID=UPI003F5118E5
MGTNIKKSDLTGEERETEEIGKGRSRLASARAGAFYLPLLLAGVMTVLFLPDLLATLVTGWTAEGGAELGIHRLHIMGIAAVVAVFLLGLFAQAYQPKKRVASMWGAFVTILVVSAGTVVFGVGRPEEVLPFLLVTSLALVAHPAGRNVLRRGNSYSPALLGLVAIAAIPLLAFAITQLSLSSSTTDPHALDGHYVMMVGLLIAPLAYGSFAALGFVGWRLASWLAALPMAYYGLLSVSFPMQASSAGLLWGSLAILWAIAFVATAEYSRVGTSATLRRAIGRSI